MIEDTIHRRRASDQQNDEIAELIKLEDDPKNRAFLIILQNINLSLIANTKTVNDIDEQLKSHLIEFRTRMKTEDALLNQTKGAWRVVSYVLSIAQMITIAALGNAYLELKALHATDADLNTRITVIERQEK